MDKFVQSKKRKRVESDSNDDSDIERTDDLKPKLCGPKDISQLASIGPVRPMLKTYPSRIMGDKKRSFVSKWYDTYKWLEYSVLEDAAYCFACRHFHNGRSTKNAFVSEGFSFWKNGAMTLTTHNTSAIHKLCMELWKESKIREQHGSKIVKSFGNDKTIAENREYIRGVIETLIITCRQNIAQRGHRENPSTKNRGNFLELLSYLGKFNPIIKKKSDTLPSCAKYTHHDIQNEIIEIMARVVKNQICDEVRAAENFAIMVDETKDISKTEQISIVLRYLYESEIHESFLGFVAAEGLTADKLYAQIKEVLATCGIDRNLCIGQCYDGAAVMSGCKNGVQKKFRADVPQAVYVHCFNHRLNLVLVDCVHDIQNAAEFFEAMESLYVFFAGSVPHDEFVKKQKEMSPSKQTIELKRLSDTRWSCQEAACKAVKETLPAMCSTLYDVAKDKNAKRAVSAKSMQSLIDFPFVITLVIMTSLLHVTKTLSDQLQSPKLQLASAIDLVKAVVATLTDARCPEEFEKLWLEGNALWDKIVSVKKTRQVRQRQQSRLFDDFVVEAPLGQRETLEDSTEFCTQVYYPVIDILITEINERFSDISCAVFEGISALNPKSAKFLDYELLSKMALHYGINTTDLEGELRLVRRMLDKKRQDRGIEVSTPMDLANALEPHRDILIDVYRLVCISVTLPVTSASCERSFSALKIIKNYLRNTSGHERTSNISVLSVNEVRTKELDIDMLIDAFATNHTNRRIILQ